MILLGYWVGLYVTLAQSTLHLTSNLGIRFNKVNTHIP